MKTLSNLPPERKRALSWIAVALALTGAFLAGKVSGPVKGPPAPTAPVIAKVSPTAPAGITPSATLEPATPTLALPAATDTAAPTSGPSATPADTAAPGPSPTSGATFTPWPDAPLCPDHDELHDNSRFHTIWDSARGCHYDHEHGEDAYSADARAAFPPELDFETLLGGVQIGSSNPSSPVENVAKHGGFKLQAELDAPHPCATGFEGATVGVRRALIQYHAFGNYAIEFESRIHSAAILAAQCQPGAPDDLGYVFTIQHQEYGQRTSPYQGDVLAYPDNFQPEFASGFGPYFTIDCVGVKLAGQRGACRTSLAQIISGNLNAASKWTSKPTGAGARPETPLLFRLLFDVRDTYQVLDWADQSYPYTFKWVCGDSAYNPLGCKYNNTTTTVHEIVGDVPAAWDNLVGFDTDSRVGRITAEGFVSRFGMPVEPGACLVPGLGCHPVKLVQAFVGRWGADLCAVKCSLITPANSPERDVYFCAGHVCAETDTGAVPSGWIGSQN